MTDKTRDRITTELVKLKEQVREIDEVMTPVIEKRRALRHKINVIECRLIRAQKEKGEKQE